MKKMLLVGLMMALLLAPAYAKSGLAFGTRTILIILPSLSLQYWANDNIGIEGSVFPYGTSGGGFAWYEGMLLFKSGGEGMQPLVGIGMANATVWSSSASASGNATMAGLIGVRTGGEGFHFTPGIEIFSSQGQTQYWPVFGFHWDF